MENSNDLYPSFLSPFSDSQARPYEIDYQVPLEYQMGMQIRDKLPPLNFNTLNEDTVFFLFYLFGNDQVQLLSAAELYRRDWRYHKEERLWLTRIKNENSVDYRSIIWHWKKNRNFFSAKRL